MKSDGIILDIDGTIWNTTAVVADAWNTAIKKLGADARPVTPRILQGQFGKPMDVIAGNLFPALTPQNRDALMQECCVQEQRAIAECKRDLTYPNVVRTIRALAETKRIFIVSNCQSGYIELTMRKTGIEDCITDWECFGNTGKQKSENIRAVAARNSLCAPVYVGDTEGDFLACREAGVPFIHAAYGFGCITSDGIAGRIESFDALLKLID